MINIEQNYEQKARITEASHIDPFCQVVVFLFLQLKLYNFNLDSEPHFINRYPLGNQNFFNSKMARFSDHHKCKFLKT